jgi:hypothetical protein
MREQSWINHTATAYLFTTFRWRVTRGPAMLPGLSRVELRFALFMPQCLISDPPLIFQRLGPIEEEFAPLAEIAPIGMMRTILD